MRRTWKLALGLPAVLAAVGEMAVANAGAQVVTSAPIGAFPMPGVQSAAPETQISLRGAPASQLGAIVVVGSRSGPHTGLLKAHSDGDGASFVLDKPLRGGERVTVRTDLDIANANDGDYAFRTVSRPSRGLGSGSGAPNLALLRQLTGQVGTAPADGVATYRSRPDLRPPDIEVRKAATGTAPGSIFLAPKKVFGAKARAGLQSGPMIIDDRGEPVWFAQNDQGNVTDFREQTYQGRPVLTWWQGRAVLGTGEGVVQMVDTSFRPVATVKAGNGYQLDLHEATVTPQGTLLSIVYNPVRRDLSFLGGPRNARVIDSVVQEIDIPTGLVMFEWHSLGQVALRDSYAPIPKGADPLYDYMHANSVNLTNDGNILVSGRELWAGLELDHRTGAIVRRIGGKRSTYKMTGTSRFAYQHDMHEQPDGTIRVFDNEGAPRVRDQSRGLVVTLDEQTKTATTRQAFRHKPDPLRSGTQGNTQALPDGHVFVGWGSQGYVSEFGADGTLLFDARIARGQDTYRAYRFPFTGTPESRPSLAALSGGRRVYASWNGATLVATWQVLAGDAPDALNLSGSAPHSGFETLIRRPATARYVAVRALGAAGNVLGTSVAIHTRP